MIFGSHISQKVVEYIEDDMVKRFWAIEFADWSEKFDKMCIAGFWYYPTGLNEF